MPPFRSFLIIQTAFIGDVILATGLIEKLRQYYPEASIDFLLRKGNEGLLTNHPLLRNVLIWDKKESKIFSLFRLIGVIRNNHYDVVVNIHHNIIVIVPDDTDKPEQAEDFGFLFIPNQNISQQGMVSQKPFISLPQKEVDGGLRVILTEFLD